MTTETTSTDLAALSGTYTIDPAHSRLGFVARHAMVTKVRGSFNDFQGRATIDVDDADRSSAQVTIQATSIDTRNSTRDDHLRSNDFLAMETYPEITFISTGVRRTGEQEVEVTGDLTIRGVTNRVTIPFTYEGAATDPFGNFRVGFEGGTIINRSDFGVSWNAPLETGGVVVSDKISLEVEISLVKDA